MSCHPPPVGVGNYYCQFFVILGVSLQKNYQTIVFFFLKNLGSGQAIIELIKEVTKILVRQTQNQYIRCY